MDPSRWEQVKKVFQEAIETAPDQRGEFVAKVCGSDTELRDEVNSLVTSHAEGGNTFIEQPAYEAVSGILRRAGVMNEDPDATRSLPIAAEAESLIPDYRLIRICGEGAFGQVWIVRDRVGTYRAMKIIDLHRLASMGVPQREMSALESYCRNVPEDPNLVQVYHIGQNEHVVYYTMELADDLVTRQPVRSTVPDAYVPMTLRGILALGRLNTDVAVEIILRLLQGLERLHEVGLVHRDIKPANILFVNRNVKLADFSLVGMTRSRMTMVGTPGYMPPDDQMDTTADTYALGKILHEMITGRNLDSFPHLPKEEQISSSRLDLDKLDEFLVTACASNAKARFASASKMRSALYACRFPLADSPLLELARESDSEWVTPATSGKADPLKSKLKSRSSLTPRSDLATKGYREDQLLMAILDRFFRMVPWLVALILGIYLIRRLTD